MLVLSWKHFCDISFLSIVSEAFTTQTCSCIVLHQMWHSRSCDLLAWEGICLPQYMLCGDNVFLWATESWCVINLLLFSFGFFVWHDERWDIVRNVDLYHHGCIIVLHPPVLLLNFFTQISYDITNKSSGQFKVCRSTTLMLFHSKFVIF